MQLKMICRPKPSLTLAMAVGTILLLFAFSAIKTVPGSVAQAASFELETGEHWHNPLPQGNTLNAGVACRM
ncbi:MAG TPA: hypothetical protein VH186_29745 [Chloroflexia bacterium]|nr:hypothetical protein [Chloroflexia bacterium]